MKTDQLRGVVDAAPFQPFNIHVADGRSVHVPHPDFILITGAGRTAIVSRPGDDWFTIIDLPLVTQLEVPALGAQA
jgi:hypothetical protein